MFTKNKRNNSSESTRSNSRKEFTPKSKDQSYPNKKPKSSVGKGGFEGNSKKLTTTEESVPVTNSIEWYTKIPAYSGISSQFNFLVPFGSSLGKIVQNRDSTNPLLSTKPAGVTLHTYLPNIGLSSTDSYLIEDEFTMTEDAWYKKQAASAFNIAVNNMFSYVRYANSGARNYYSADMGLMLLSVCSIYSVFALVWRVLSASKNYFFDNKYLGNALVNAMGFNFDDIRKNYNSYVSRLALDTLRCNTIRAPKGISLVDRWMWLNGRVFLDDNKEGKKNQFHVFRPECLYKYDEINSKCVPVRLHNPNTDVWNLSDLLTRLEEAITALTTSESFNIMMGDILKAYGEDGLYQLPIFKGDEPLSLGYDVEMALQLQNATLCHDYFHATVIPELTVNLDLLEVKQDLRQSDVNTGCLYQGEPIIFTNLAQGSHLWGLCLKKWDVTSDQRQEFLNQVKLYNSEAKNNLLVNIYTDETDSNITILSTRLMAAKFMTCSMTPVDEEKYRGYWGVKSCGTELLIDSRIMWIADSASSERAEQSSKSKVKKVNEKNKKSQVKVIGQISVSNDFVLSYYVLRGIYIDGRGAELLDMCECLALADQFSLRVRFSRCKPDTEQDEPYSRQFFTGPLICPVMLTLSDLAKIHDPCIYSEWTIPGADGIKGLSAYGSKMASSTVTK